MFSLGHFIWLGIILVIVVTALTLLKKYNVSTAKVGKISMIIAIVGKVVHLALSMKESSGGGMVIDQTQLDFHLCSVQVYGANYGNRRINGVTYTNRGGRPNHAKSVAIYGSPR